MTNKNKKVFVIPKVGYIHYLGRKDSLIEKYKEQVDNDEAAYWLSVAKKEYFFKEEREVAPYSKNETKE